VSLSLAFFLTKIFIHFQKEMTINPMKGVSGRNRDSPMLTVLSPRINPPKTKCTFSGSSNDRESPHRLDTPCSARATHVEQIYERRVRLLPYRESAGVLPRGLRAVVFGVRCAGTCFRWTRAREKALFGVQWAKKPMGAGRPGERPAGATRPCTAGRVFLGFA
jgi:hypothetical protein